MAELTGSDILFQSDRIATGNRFQRGYRLDNVDDGDFLNIQGLHDIEAAFCTTQGATAATIDCTLNSPAPGQVTINTSGAQFSGSLLAFGR